MTRLLRVLLPLLVLTFTAACGTPATLVIAPLPTLVLPTRVAILPTAGGTEPTRAPAVAVAPTTLLTIVPTRVRPAASPTITLIPTKAPPSATPLPSPTTPPTADPAAERGQVLFAQGVGTEGVPTCASCHYVDKDDPFTGPSQKGLARRAGTRVAGQDAATYIRNSIINPNAYIVPNQKDAAGNDHIYGVGGQSLMYQDYAKHLSDAQVNDLVAYLLTLR